MFCLPQTLLHLFRVAYVKAKRVFQCYRAAPCHCLHKGLRFCNTFNLKWFYSWILIEQMKVVATILVEEERQVKEHAGKQDQLKEGRNKVMCSESFRAC